MGKRFCATRSVLSIALVAATLSLFTATEAHAECAPLTDHSVVETALPGGGTQCEYTRLTPLPTYTPSSDPYAYPYAPTAAPVDTSATQITTLTKQVADLQAEIAALKAELAQKNDAVKSAKRKLRRK